MKTKEEITKNWLPRYTGARLDQFGSYILLTNFKKYLKDFCELTGAEIIDSTAAMPMATSGDITMINFGMGSANAATIMDLLSSTSPKAVLFLGKCGGVKKKNRLGDFILPFAPMITYHQKFLHYQPLVCKKRSQQLFATIIKTIIRERFSQPIDVFGNLMKSLKNI